MRNLIVKNLRNSWVWAGLPILLLSLCSCAQTESEFDRKRSPHGEADLIVTVAEPALPHGEIQNSYLFSHERCVTGTASRHDDGK